MTRVVGLSYLSNDEGTSIQITIARPLPGQRFDNPPINVDDLPEDFRQALRAWTQR